MNKKQIAEIIQEHKDKLNSMEIATLIADAINKEWYYSCKDISQVVIE